MRHTVKLIEQIGNGFWRNTDAVISDGKFIVVAGYTYLNTLVGVFDCIVNQVVQYICQAMSMERRKTMKLRPEDIQLREFVEEIAAAQRMRGDKDITINVNVADNIVVEADTTHLANSLDVS